MLLFFFFIKAPLFLFFLFIYLFLAALGLRCCAQAFSSCSEQAPLFAAVCGLLLLQSTGSRLAGFSSCSTRAQSLWRTGLVAPRHVGSSRTRARSHVPCIDRRILNHCATREALLCGFTSRAGSSLCGKDGSKNLSAKPYQQKESTFCTGVLAKAPRLCQT